MKTALRDLVAFIEANEPQLVAYGAYIDGDGTRMTGFHVHVDSASLELHLDVAGPAFRPFVDLVRLSSIQIYGAPSERAMDQLREKARLLGAGDVVVHPPLAGFFRTKQSTGTNRTPSEAPQPRLTAEQQNPRPSLGGGPGFDLRANSGDGG